MKIFSGGWLPIVVAVCIFTVLTTWEKGREVVTQNREREEGSLSGFIEVLQVHQPPVIRVPGTAVFLNRSTQTTPLAMRENVEHNRVLHESVVIVTIEIDTVPYVPAEKRFTIDDLYYRDDGISRVVARYGFQEHIDVPALGARSRRTGARRPFTSTTSPTSCPRSKSSRPTRRRWPRGASGYFWLPLTSPSMLWTTSSSPGTARCCWVRRSRSECRPAGTWLIPLSRGARALSAGRGPGVRWLRTCRSAPSDRWGAEPCAGLQL